MKKYLLVLIVVIALAVFATPVLADDPTELNTEINISGEVTNTEVNVDGVTNNLQINGHVPFETHVIVYDYNDTWMKNSLKEIEATYGDLSGKVFEIEEGVYIISESVANLILIADNQNTFNGEVVGRFSTLNEQLISLNTDTEDKLTEITTLLEDEFGIVYNDLTQLYQGQNSLEDESLKLNSDLKVAEQALIDRDNDIESKIMYLDKINDDNLDDVIFIFAVAGGAISVVLMISVLYLLRKVRNI